MPRHALCVRASLGVACLSLPSSGPAWGRRGPRTSVAPALGRAPLLLEEQGQGTPQTQAGASHRPPRCCSHATVSLGPCLDAPEQHPATTSPCLRTPLSPAPSRPPGWYLFQFHRLLQYVRPGPGSPRPFFWMFVDNLVLNKEDQDVASRFLEVCAGPHGPPSTPAHVRKGLFGWRSVYTPGSRPGTLWSLVSRCAQGPGELLCSPGRDRGAWDMKPLRGQPWRAVPPHTTPVLTEHGLGASPPAAAPSVSTHTRAHHTHR